MMRVKIENKLYSMILIISIITVTLLAAITSNSAVCSSLLRVTTKKTPELQLTIITGIHYGIFRANGQKMEKRFLLMTASCFKFSNMKRKDCKVLISKLCQRFLLFVKYSSTIRTVTIYLFVWNLRDKCMMAETFYCQIIKTWSTGS